ncbi:MAG: hypothetical protein NTX55_00060 [Candidatus Parcubacteria bacterium]|nr:hypothetical protein [Candidatus Parcubacteria bacterium]
MELLFEGGGDMETVKDQDGFAYDVSQEGGRLVYRKKILEDEKNYWQREKNAFLRKKRRDNDLVGCLTGPFLFIHRLVDKKYGRIYIY